MSIDGMENQLLREALKGNLESVIELLKKGANVNFQDAEGNTPLHYAIRYGYLDIVKLLLKEKADVNVENYEIKSPLDLADNTFRANIDDIIMTLHKNVIDKSFEILENHGKKQAKVSFSKSVGTDLKSGQSSNGESDLIDKILFKEIKKKEGRIKSCLKQLKAMNVAKRRERTKFSYEQANLLLYFLEAFSFESLYINVSDVNFQEKIKVKIQSHFSKYISKMGDVRKLIDDVRTLLCYNSNTVINLEDIGKLVCSGIGPRAFFETLEKCVASILGETNRRPKERHSFKKISSILTVDETIGKQGEEILWKEWKNFFSAIHDEPHWSQNRTQEILFSFLVNIAPSVEKDAPNFQKIRYEVLDELPNLDIKKKLYEIFSSKNIPLELYCKVFEHIKIHEDKIKSVKRYLSRLNKETGFRGQEFTYRQANIFIIFLEGFEFNKAHHHLSESHGIYGIVYTVLKLVEKHFERYIPGFNSNQMLMKEVREILCCSSNQIITLEDVVKMVCSGIEAKSFFINIEEYVRNVCDLLDGSGDNKIADLNSFLMPTKTTGEQSHDLLKELLGIQIGIVNGNEEWTTEKTQKLLFNFLVNVTPSLKQEVIGLSKLLSKVRDKFHQFYDAEDILKYELGKAVFQFRSLVFKYYYAKEAVEKFHQIKPEEDCSKIDDNLRKSLKEFEHDFEESFKGPSDNKLSSTEDICWFETLLFQASLYPELEDLALKELAIEYFKFMIILDDQTTKRYYEFPTRTESFNIRRILLRYIWELKYYKTHFPNKYLKEKKEIREALEVYSGVKEIDYNDVFQFYIENDSLQNQGNKYEEEIIIVVQSLRRIQRKFKCSNHAIIALYRRVVEQKQEFEFEQNADLFKNCTISDVEKAQLNKELKELYNDDTVEPLLNGKIIKASTCKVVSNILETFYSAFSSYQIKFGNLVNSFNDKVVLANMVYQEDTYCKNYNKDIENSIVGKHLSMLFGKMLNLAYLAPFIANLVSNAETCINLDRKHITEVIKVLINEDAYIDHLNDLLKVDCGFNLYEIVWKTIPKMNLEILRPIFEDPVHVNIFLMFFKILSLNEKSDDTIAKLEEGVMMILNDIVVQQPLKTVENCDRSLLLLAVYTSDEYGYQKYQVLKGRYLKIRTRICRERLSTYVNKCDIPTVENYKSSLKECLETKTALEKIPTKSFEFSELYLMNLHLSAYLLYLLEKFRESYDAYETLFRCIRSYTLLNMPLDNYGSIDMEPSKDITKILECQKYKELLRNLSQDSEVVDVMKIRMNMARIITWSQSNDKQGSFFTKYEKKKFYYESIEAFREVYVMQKLKQPNGDGIVDVMRNIAFMMSNLSQLKKKDEAFKFKVEALFFYKGAFKYCKDPTKSKKSLKEIFKILLILANDKYSILGLDESKALQMRLKKIKNRDSMALN